jgi:hypothetical protein
MAPTLPFLFISAGDVILRAIRRDFDDIHVAVVSVVLDVAFDVERIITGN